MNIGTKSKNKVNPETGHFICHRCSTDIALGVVIRGCVYCLKCGDILKGKRTRLGQLIEPSPDALQ